MKRIRDLNWEWIRKQLEAIPYLMAAVMFCGALWLLTSLFVIVFE